MAVFRDSDEYTRRKNTPFVPPNLDYVALRKALPRDVWQRSTRKSLLAMSRLIFTSLMLHALGVWLWRGAQLSFITAHIPPSIQSLVNVTGWTFYLWWQPIIWAGFWSLGKCSLFVSSAGIYQ